MFAPGDIAMHFRESDVIKDRVATYVSSRRTESTRALAQAIAAANHELLEGHSREERVTALFLAVTTLFTNEILNDPEFHRETKPLSDRLSRLPSQNWIADGLRVAFERQAFLFENILAPIVEEGLETIRIPIPLVDSPKLDPHPNSD